MAAVIVGSGASYSHPKWGGNKDKLAWKMIGYEDWWV